MSFKEQYDDAHRRLDTLSASDSPGIADYAALLKARLLDDEHREEEAAGVLEKLKDHSEQPYIRAEAIYELANLRARMRQKDAARELYKTLVSEYSGSVYSVEAGRLYRELGN